MEFVLLNGELVEKNTATISITNRSFRFGDGLFESMHYRKGEIIFFEKHFERLQFGMKLMQFENENVFSAEKIQSLIQKLVVANGSFASQKIRLHLWRSNGSLYAPTNNNFEYLIETFPIDEKQFCNPDANIRLGIFTAIKKPINDWSKIKSASSLIYVMAGLEGTKQNANEMLVLNEQGNIADTTGSNVFLFSNGTWKTTDQHQGAVNGVFQSQLISLLHDQNIGVETGLISIDDLKAAQEIFTCNVAAGIKPVLFFDDIKYQASKCAELILLVKSKWFSD